MGWKEILKYEGRNNSHFKYREKAAEEDDPHYFDSQVRRAISELNNRGVSIMDFPASTRHRAFELEEQFTQAANKADLERFLEILTEWKNCFH